MFINKMAKLQRGKKLYVLLCLPVQHLGYELRCVCINEWFVLSSGSAGQQALTKKMTNVNTH